MSASRARLRERVVELLRAGSLAKSDCSAQLTAFLRPVLDAGVLIEGRAGAGRRISVQAPVEWRAWVEREFPDVEVSADAPARVQGLARYRASKALRGDTPEVITVRAWSDAALLRHGSPVSASVMTATHGVFAFVLRADGRYEVRGTCGLVENPTVLQLFERLGLHVSCVIYGGGRVSRRVITWLAKQEASDFRLIHLPDYDPVGLSDFLRVRAALGSRVSLHLPVNLAEMFDRFSNRSLLQRPGNQALLPGLRKSVTAEVQTVLGLIEKHNAGLEQEAPLIGDRAHIRGVLP